jgi:anti-sigma factor RsiW
MQDASAENHAAAAWLAGNMDPAQQQEFAAHLAGCVECQAEVAALRAAQALRAQTAVATKVESEPAPAATKPRAWQVLLAAIVTVVVGFALGWSVWQMAHH